MTHTAHSGLNTGIQRVVRKIAEHLPGIASADQIPCHVVVFRDGCFQRFNSQRGFASWDYRRIRNEFSGLLPDWYKRTLARCLGKNPENPLYRFLVPSPRKLGVFLLPIFLFSVCLWIVRMLTLPLRRVRFQSDDILLLPDGYWVVKRIWPGIENAKHLGAKIVFVIYDLITLTHPQFFVEGSKDAFEKYLQNVIKNADLILTISNTVANELRAAILEPHLAFASPSIQSFTLGADIATANSPIRESVQELFTSDGPVFLVASTLEPRKNHKVVLDAFDRIWQTHGTRLLFVGRKGWLHSELIERIQSSQFFNERLFVFHDLNDNELSRCYESCAGVICPSHAEGFGLPIIEALLYGKTVFVSDIPIHREVGQNDCIYFSKDSGLELSSSIEQFILKDTPIEKDAASRRKAVTWKESTQQLYDRIQQMLPPAKV